MRATHVAIIGDRSEKVLAHRAVDASLAKLRAEELDLEWRWCATDELAASASLRDFVESCDGIWCVPATPYRNTEAAISAIRFARENGVPFLGTCGGFQHAVLELVRDVLGESDAEHAEIDPQAARLAVTPLACSLVEVRASVLVNPGTKLATIVGRPELEEGFHCRYGMNPAYETKLAARGVVVSARDAEGEARAIELPSHPFFVATLFQPERAALAGELHEIVRAFVDAAREHAGR